MKISMIESIEELIRRIPSIEALEKEMTEFADQFHAGCSQKSSAIASELWIRGNARNPEENTPTKRTGSSVQESSSQPTGWFGSYYIGPTSDEVMKEMPTPLHAADYIAQQHDLEYQELGLNGVIGTLNSRSNEADHRLIERCNELIAMYEKGERSYHNFPITPIAYHAAYYMKEYFIVEESITDFFRKKSDTTKIPSSQK